MGVVGLRGDPVDFDDGLAAGDVEVVGSEPDLAQNNVGGGVVSNVVQTVVDHNIHTLNKIFVLNLKNLCQQMVSDTFEAGTYIYM